MSQTSASAWRILIVEDETIVALDMRCRLEGFGYQVCGLAATGPVAIQMAADHRPDLILMDIKLKGEMDGIEASELIRGSFAIPIVFVTAFTDDETLERVKAMSSYGYIVKPYHERELKITIELALSKFEYERGLLVAKATAEENDRAKSRFLSNVSHELKTPLNAIIGFTDLAATMEQDVELKEYVTLAARSARKLEAIINCILDYTKLESGALVPVYSEFNLEDFLLRCWEPFSMEAQAKGLTTRFYLDPDLPALVRCDASKLGTAVKALVDNAVKFTDTGYVLLSAQRILSTRDGITSMELQIRVSDSGRGIPDEKRQRIFDRFMQVDDSPTRVTSGLGLGLALVKGIADLLNLKLGLQKSPEDGSDFSLTLGLPLGTVSAYGESQNALLSMRIGLLSPCAAAEEIEHWAHRLGGITFKLDSSLGDIGPDLSCDVFIADVPEWSRISDAARERILGSCGGPRNLVLLDTAIVGRNGLSEGLLPSLCYPVSLSSLVERLGLLRRDTKSLAVPSGGKPPISPPGACRTGLATTSQDSAYLRLTQEALIEASQRGLHRDLNAFLTKLLAAVSGPRPEEAERIAKLNYDRFTEAGDQACARFALALLMDSRRHSEHWHGELKTLAELVRSQLAEAKI